MIAIIALPLLVCFALCAWSKARRLRRLAAELEAENLRVDHIMDLWYHRDTLSGAVEWAEFRNAEMRRRGVL